MAERALALPDGRWLVPGNRADLLDATVPGRVPSVSVVVPHHRAQAQLDLVLTALALQTHPRHRLEVVVADDGSPTLPRVTEAADGLDVRVVAQPDRGFRAAAARNLGARSCSGDVLCFLDGDTVPEPGYVSAAARLPALLPDAVVTGRRRHAELTGWTPPRLRHWLTGGGPAPVELEEPGWLTRLSTGDLAGDHAYRAVISAVLTCGRDLFTEVGGFDETFTRYGGEDWELAHRLLTAGAVLAHERHAVAWHDGPDWAGRARAEGDRRAHEQKAAEHLAVAERVPPERRDGEWFPRPDTVVVVHGPDPATAVREVLAVPEVDPGVWLSATSAVTTTTAVTATDRRVHHGEVPAAVLAGCRTLVELAADRRLHPGELAQLVARVRPGGAGTVRTPGLVVTAARARHRARRWAPVLGIDEDALLQRLQAPGSSSAAPA